MKSEWELFVVGKGPPVPSNSSWRPLLAVHHGTHLKAAGRIAEDERIASDLVADGRLASTREKFVFTTPKRWPDGNRYGSFEFELDWLHVIKGRQLYWVESLAGYEVPVFRILASRKDVSALPVVPYDPVADQGPVRLVGTEWYWARDHAAEILLDEDVPLADINTLSFAKHDDKRCSQRPGGSCPEAGAANSWHSHAALMSMLLGRRLTSLDKLLVQNGKFSPGAFNALGWLWFYLGGVRSRTGPLANDAQAADLLRSALLLLHAGDRDGALQVLDLVDAQSRVLQSFEQAIEGHFGVPAWD
ncbi:MAG: hypothetical protein ACRYGP_17405 [Janthinobacterium lividum]